MGANFKEMPETTALYHALEKARKFGYEHIHGESQRFYLLVGPFCFNFERVDGRHFVEISITNGDKWEYWHDGGDSYTRKQSWGAKPTGTINPTIWANNDFTEERYRRLKPAIMKILNKVYDFIDLRQNEEETKRQRQEAERNVAIDSLVNSIADNFLKG